MIGNPHGTCDVCDQSFEFVGWDKHHGVALVRCACCTLMPDPIRELEREGNAALANGLTLMARQKFRLADALKRRADA